MKKQKLSLKRRTITELLPHELRAAGALMVWPPTIPCVGTNVCASRGPGYCADNL
jgi:hypothetical protein